MPGKQMAREFGCSLTTRESRSKFLCKRKTCCSIGCWPRRGLEKGFNTPRGALTDSEIHDIINKFTLKRQTTKQSGFYWSANTRCTWLPCQPIFYLQEHNQRDDKWGVHWRTGFDL
ncbi:hypothetical protein OH492_27365 [Vibrio chagasii]|nr:hypothetical protein [Vibrio chagasii]